MCERVVSSHKGVWGDRVVGGRDSRAVPTFQAWMVVCIEGVRG